MPTLPDFLERRFNRRCRDWLAVISIFSAIVIHMGVALYTAAWVLRGILNIAADATILGIDAMMFFIIVLGVLTGDLHHDRRPAGGGLDGEHPDRPAVGRGGVHHGGGLLPGRRLARDGPHAGQPSPPAGTVVLSPTAR